MFIPQTQFCNKGRFRYRIFYKTQAIMTYLGQNKEKSLFCLISFLIFAIMFYTFWPKQNNCSIQDYSKVGILCKFRDIVKKSTY